MVNFIAISGTIHTFGIFLITIGLLKQFNFSITEALFGFLLTPEQAGALLTTGLLMTLIAFWIQSLVPPIKAGRITKFIQKVF